MRKQFERVSRNPRHQIGMERRHEFEPFAAGVALGLLAGGLEILAMLDQLGAESAHRTVLLDRIA